MQINPPSAYAPAPTITWEMHLKSATVRDIGKVCAIFNQKLKCNTCQEQCVLIKLTKLALGQGFKLKLKLKLTLAAG